MRTERERGFSLLELLVGLFVVVLVTSLITLNIGSGDRDILLRAAVEGFADSANYALDEAQFSGMNYGLVLRMADDDGNWRYHFDWYEQGLTGWRAPASGKDIFASTSLPIGLEVQMLLNEVELEQEALVPDSTTPQPQLMFYASGETVPGEMMVRDSASGDVVWRIEWDLLGNFKAIPGDGLPEGAPL